MCFSQPSAPPPAPVAAAPPAPTRAAEEIRAGVASEIADLRKRRGSEATVLTGGLGDASYGTNVAKTQLGV